VVGKEPGALVGLWRARLVHL